MPKSVRGVMKSYATGAPAAPKVKARKQAAAKAAPVASDVERGGYNWRDGRHRKRKA